MIHGTPTRSQKLSLYLCSTLYYTEFDMIDTHCIYLPKITYQVPDKYQGGCQLISQEQKLQKLTEKVPGIVVRPFSTWGEEDLGPCWQEDQWQTSGVYTFIMTGKADLDLSVLRAPHKSMAGGRELAHSPQVPLGLMKVCGVSQQPSLYVQTPVHHSPLSRPGSKRLHTGGEMYSEKEKYLKRGPHSPEKQAHDHVARESRVSGAETMETTLV